MSRTLKVYLAAPYQMKDTITARAAELAAEGIEVTSSWLKEKHKPTTQMKDLTHEEHEIYADQDVEDVLNADVLVFQDDPTIPRAGRHVEFGMAVMIGRILRPMPIFVVGQEYANIFHHRKNVTHFDDWAAVKAQLVTLAKVAQAE